MRSNSDVAVRLRYHDGSSWCHTRGVESTPLCDGLPPGGSCFSWVDALQLMGSAFDVQRRRRLFPAR